MADAVPGSVTPSKTIGRAQACRVDVSIRVILLRGEDAPQKNKDSRLAPLTPLLSHSSCTLSHFALNSCDFSHAKGQRDGRF
jgi:hypothetical protein